MQLKRSLQSAEGRELFVSLFACWAHNPVAALALCLLAQAYELAAALAFQLADAEVTVGFFLQLDKLVRNAAQRSATARNGTGCCEECCECARMHVHVDTCACVHANTPIPRISWPYILCCYPSWGFFLFLSSSFLRSCPVPCPTRMHARMQVQLLESPIFIPLRLQLLEPHRYPFLLKALYGVLMLLPQVRAVPCAARG